MKSAPFFIAGSKRGGTTLLRLMLNKNSALCIPPESHFFLPLLKTFDPGVQLRKEELKKAKEIISAHPRFNTWNIKDADFNEILNSLPIPCPFSLFITAVFEQQIKSSGKERWGEKTPEYTEIISKIAEIFPEAFFIAFVRDGRDVGISLKERGWHGWSIYERATYWKNCVDNLQLLQKSDSKTIFIKYEDLVIHPQKTLTEICNFLGVNFEEQMLRYYEDFRENVPEQDIQTGAHSKLGRLPKVGDINKWKETLTRKEIWKFESVFYRELNQMGYEIAHFNKNNPIHLAGGFCYSLVGIFSSMIYKIHHKIFSSNEKKTFRNNRAYKRLRRIIRDI